MRNNKRGYLRSFMMAGILSLTCFLVLLSCKKDSQNPLNSNSVLIICIDIDGNTYHTIQIGNQVWMAEDLRVTRYQNGNVIGHVTDDTQWSNLSSGAYCAFDNIASNADVYGYLYNWYAVHDPRNIAPSGWHVPTDAEWQTLVDYLGGESSAGGKLKEAGTSHWNSPNTEADNSSGFTGLPGGWRDHNVGSFVSLGFYANFWSSTEFKTYTAWSWSLGYFNSNLHRAYAYKQTGFSVRCVKD